MDVDDYLREALGEEEFNRIASEKKAEQVRDTVRLTEFISKEDIRRITAQAFNKETEGEGKDGKEGTGKGKEGKEKEKEEEEKEKEKEDDSGEDDYLEMDSEEEKETVTVIDQTVREQPIKQTVVVSGYSIGEAVTVEQKEGEEEKGTEEKKGKTTSYEEDFEREEGSEESEIDDYEKEELEVSEEEEEEEEEVEIVNTIIPDHLEEGKGLGK